MKISKIACVALMSVALSSGAYALDAEKTNWDRAEAEHTLANTINKQLPNIFKDAGQFKDITDKNSVPKSFQDAVIEILKAAQKVNLTTDTNELDRFKDIDLGTVSGHAIKITIEDQDAVTKKVELKITQESNSDVFKLIDKPDGGVELDITLHTTSILKTLGEHINTPENATDVKTKLEEKVNKEGTGLVDITKKDIGDKKGLYETALVLDANNVINSHADYLVKNQDRIMAEKDKAITDATKKLNDKIAEINKGGKVSIKNTEATKVNNQITKLEGLEALLDTDYTNLSGSTTKSQLDTAIANLKTAIVNGVTIKHEDKVLTIEALDAMLAESNAASDDSKAQEIGNKLAPTVGDSTDKGARKAVDEAKTAITPAKTLAQNTMTALNNKKDIIDAFEVKDYVENAKDAFATYNGPNNALDGGAQFVFNNAKDDLGKKTKEFNDAVKAAEATNKVSIKDKTTDGVEKQKADIDDIQSGWTGLKTQDKSKNNEKVEALNKAIEAGIPLMKDGKPLTKADIDALLKDTTKTDDDKSGALNTWMSDNETAVNDAKTQIDNAQSKIAAVTLAKTTLETATTNLEKAKNNFLNTSKIRANMITKKPDSKLSSTQSGQILKGLADIVVDNEIAGNTLAGKDVADVVNFANANEVSIKQAISSMTQTADIDIVKFSSNLSTNTRLAKLSNPFNEDLALAYAVKNLEGEKFADNGNSLSSVVKGYTDRYNYDNNLWGNIIGAKGKIKDGANPELYGFTLGYDKAFDNTIVGGFLTYAKSKLDGDLIENKANNYQIGLYTRTFVDNHEIDTKLSIGTSKNKLDRQVVDGLKTYDQKGDYKTIFASVAFDYGYVVALSDTAFVKPIIGVEYAYAKNKAFDESGKLPLAYNANTSKTLALKAAAEFRKYVENGNYLYITPGLESEIYKKSGDMIARFVGSTTDINFGANDKKSTYFTLQTGAEMKLTENLSTNINFGAKYKSKEQYYNGTLGLKYKF